MEAVGQLTGGIAHDFNNVLQGIAGNLDLIRRKPGAPERVRRWSEAGLQAAERGARLAEQLLAFSRTQKLQIRPLNISRTVAGFAEVLHRSIGATIQVHTDLSTGDQSVLGDQVQLEMAVLNLALNARDAMPDGGNLTISTRVCRIANDRELADGKYVELSVNDNGDGMPPHVVERAFEPFYTTKEVGKGTGLGLSQVYGMVMQSGGKVLIESVVGKGTSVRLYLRCTDFAAQDGDQRVTTHEQSLGSSARILVIDDDPDVRRFLSSHSTSWATTVF